MMNNIADMEAHDAWLAERPDFDDEGDRFDTLAVEWKCPKCDNTEGCDYCTPPF